MKLDIQMHVAEISLSNTITILDGLSVQNSRKSVHDWVQKAYLQPVSAKAPNQIAIEETVIRKWPSALVVYHCKSIDKQNCLSSVVFNQPLLLRYFSKNCGKNTMSKPPFFLLLAQNISEKHCNDPGSDFRQNATEIGMQSNISSEK